MKNQVTILSIVKQENVDKTKEIFNRVIEKYYEAKPDEVLKIGQPRQVPNQLLFALDVPLENAIQIIKELTYEGVSVIKNETL